MIHLRYLCASAVLSLLLSGCSSPPPGQPQKDAETVAPDQIVEFATLYSQNCAGCHGAQGRGGAAIALADPVYLAIVDEAIRAQSHRQRRTRNLDASFRAERRRNADGQTG